MDLDLIKSLAEVFSQNDLDKLKIVEGDFEILMEKSSPILVEQSQATQPSIAVDQGPQSKEISLPRQEGKYIKSPLVGTFYRAASPQTPAFVEVGDEVGIGDTLCIVESMKMFNEIKSDVAGRVGEILVEDGQMVEFDQELIRIED